MLMTLLREVIERPGRRRYLPGFMAYSMDEEGETSIFPSTRYRFSSVGIPSTTAKGKAIFPVRMPAWTGKQFEYII
jgi:hypothetical protein